jgi:hypothetical protein
MVVYIYLCLFPFRIFIVFFRKRFCHRPVEGFEQFLAGFTVFFHDPCVVILKQFVNCVV